jgi:hypothetical protein
MFDKDVSKSLLKTLLRSRHKIQEQKSAEWEEEARKARAGREKPGGPPLEPPAGAKTPRYIDFSIEMPLNDPDRERTGSFVITMAGGGEARCDATWYRLVKDKEGTVRPNFEVLPVMAFLDKARDNLEREKAKAQFKFEMAATPKEIEEAKSEIESISVLKWGFKGSIKGQTISDAVTVAKRQAAINQVDTLMFNLGVSKRQKGMLYMEYQEPGEDAVTIGYVKTDDWQGFKTGIDVPLHPEFPIEARFDLYEIDKWIVAPMQAFARQWSSNLPNVHVVLPSADGNTPAIIIFPVGSSSYIAAVLTNQPKE